MRSKTGRIWDRKAPEPEGAAVTSDIVNAIPVPAFLVTDADILAEANDAFRQRFPRMQIGRSYLTILRQPGLVALVESVKAGNASDAVELASPGRGQGSFSATAGKLGEFVLVCLQDLAETSAAIQMRQNFVSDLGHELKTPLTAISGILETSSGDATALEQFLPALSTEVDRMKNLVADLLTLSRVESNEKRTPNQEIILQSVIEEACAPLAVLARETGTRIETVLPAGPVHFEGDPDELNRAIKNLVENGLRYGDRGGVVTVTGSTCRFDSRNEARAVSIEVSNDGPGVENHHIPRLTERFYRVDGHRSRESGGSGLGLAIVKHVVFHHRGRMTMESPDNKGFRVVLVLPLKQESP